MSHDAPSHDSPSHGARDSRLIAGRYLLGDRIGRGGMGTVWRAADQLLGREVAVKELNPETGTATASALREARAVAQIKHPHVIVVHDVVVEDDERPYIVMELVVGGSLADRLREGGRSARRRRPGSASRCSALSGRPTREGSCTGTSSRRTSWSRTADGSW